MKNIFRTAILSSLLVSTFTFADSTPDKKPTDWGTTENCQFNWDFSQVEDTSYQVVPEEYQSTVRPTPKPGHCELISIQGNNPEGPGSCSVVARCYDTAKTTTDPTRWLMNEFTTSEPEGLNMVKANDRGYIYGY